MAESTAVLDVAKARKELQQKSLAEIERATALTWGARAAAAFALAGEEAQPERRWQWRLDAESYRQEALEHAAQTEDWTFLADVAAQLRAAAHPQAAPRKPGTRAVPKPAKR